MCLSSYCNQNKTIDSSRLTRTSDALTRSLGTYPQLTMKFAASIPSRQCADLSMTSENLRSFNGIRIEGVSAVDRQRSNYFFHRSESNYSLREKHRSDYEKGNIDMSDCRSTKSKYQRSRVGRQINHRNRQKLFGNAEKYFTWVNNTIIYLFDLRQRDPTG